MLENITPTKVVCALVAPWAFVLALAYLSPDWPVLLRFLE